MASALHLPEVDVTMDTATTDTTTRGFLERNPVFTTAEFRSALPARTSSSAVLNRLLKAHRRGYAERVTRGLYVSRVAAPPGRLPDPLLIASKLAPDCVVAYHSALEAHGVAHSPFRQVTFLSTHTPFKLVYRDHEFLGLRPASPLVTDEAWRRFTVALRRGDSLITVTSRERTLVDCLAHLDRAGGLEEVLRSVGGFPSLDVHGVLAYVESLHSPGCAAKVGWVLSADPDLWRVTSAELEALRSLIGKGPYFLASRDQAKTFVPEWRLYVPAGLDARELMRQ